MDVNNKRSSLQQSHKFNVHGDVQALNVNKQTHNMKVDKKARKYLLGSLLNCSIVQDFLTYVDINQLATYHYHFKDFSFQMLHFDGCLVFYFQGFQNRNDNLCQKLTKKLLSSFIHCHADCSNNDCDNLHVENMGISPNMTKTIGL